MAPPPVPGMTAIKGDSPAQHAQNAHHAQNGAGEGAEQASAMDVEFEQAWEHAGELGEEDFAAFRE